MAKTQTPFVFFFFFLIFLTLDFYTHTSLVYAIRQENQQEQRFGASPILSLSLHPYDSITKSKNKNYTALTISRLAADSARVNYIKSRIRHAISKFDPNIELEDLQSPLTSTRGEGGYAALIGVGQPAKQFHLLADTGSDINWLQCAKCTECFNQSDPIFDSSKSSSYQPLSCASQRCNALGNEKQCSRATGKCNYEVVYGDFSGSSGEFATETVSFGSSGSVNNVSIGCGLFNHGFSDFAGILGLGGGQVSLPSQIKATSFSYCLVDPFSNSSSTLEFNPATPSDSVIVPFQRNPATNTFYYVQLTGITVGNDLISIPPSVYRINVTDGSGGIIVDSGTTLTLLNSKVYIPLRDAFRNNSKGFLPPSFGEFQGFDTCYDIPTESVSKVKGPPMAFQFSGGKSLLLPGENSLVRAAISEDGSSTKLCFAFFPQDDFVSIIGNVVQRGLRVTYDIRNKNIGFSPNKC